MAYDEELAFRVRAMLDDADGLTERSMFGGLAFLLNGNMAIVVSGRGGLMARLTPDIADVLLDEPGVTPFEMRGKPIAGWLRVEADAVDEDAELRKWVDRCVDFAASLPAK
jgi:TfoX/Sxy family transcriptional regulator of competence genes